MNVTIVGAGFVGLVTASVLADFGNDVWVLENNTEKLGNLLKGKIPFYEPGLETLFLKNIKVNRLHLTSSYQEALAKTEVVFVCVGTPDKGGRVYLQYVYNATAGVARNLKESAIVVIKSTVPPGLNDEIERRMRKYTKVDFSLASVPEFLREGKAIEDTLHPYRVVIGAKEEETAQKLLALHEPITGERVICDPISAQMIKYASNAFLPTKISFANSIAVLCDQCGADVEKVLGGVGLDRRIGPDFLGAGVGYGGSCFPKDVAALIGFGRKKGYNFKILKAVQATNKEQVNYFLGKIKRLCGGSLKGKKITVLGLAFKPDTSDMRDASSLSVIAGLKEMGAKVTASDPVAIPFARRLIDGIEFVEDPYQALEGAEALVLVTEWNEYRSLDFSRVRKLMKSRIVIDGRNVYNRNMLEQQGFIYEGVGK